MDFAYFWFWGEKIYFWWKININSIESETKAKFLFPFYADILSNFYLVNFILTQKELFLFPLVFGFWINELKNSS